MFPPNQINTWEEVGAIQKIEVRLAIPKLIKSDSIIRFSFQKN